MTYPYKYPELYAELARQGKHKRNLAAALNITMAGLRYKQTSGDFNGDEMKAASEFLKCPAAVLFSIDENCT